MPSITQTYVEVLPETSKIADGIRKALYGADDDVRAAARRWGEQIERELGDVKVELKADTTKAKAELDEAARDRDSTIHVDVDRDNLSQIATTVTRTVVPQFANAGQQAGDTFMGRVRWFV
jgi:hypothetical protein